MMPLRYLAVGLLLATSLTACGWLGEKDAPPLEGKRLPVLQAPSADALAIQKTEDAPRSISLPEASANTVWGQALGYPTHNPQHLAITGDLSQKLWSASLGKGSSVKAPLMPSPIIVENTVYGIDTAGSVSAFELNGGKKLWKITTRGEDQDKDELSAGGGIAYGRNMLIITNGSRDVIALNPQTGVPVWRVSLDAPLRGAPTVLGGRAYLADTSNHIIALDSASGSKVWTFNGAAQDIALLGTPAPAIDTRYAVGALSSGTLVGIELADGNTAWQARFNTSAATDTSLTNLRDIASAPVIDENHVYAINASGRMIALNAATGQRLWQKDVRGTGAIWAAGDTVFIITREGVAARSATDGEIVWEAALPQFRDTEDKENPITWYGPYLLSGKLYAFGSHGDAATFNPTTGAMLGVISIESNLAAAPAVANGVVALVDSSGRLTVRK